MVLGILAVVLPDHTLRDAFAVLAILAVAVASWDPDVALVGILAYLPFRTLVGAVAPLPLKFAADAAVAALFVRLAWRHPRSLAVRLDWVEGLGLAFLVYALFATVHAHARLEPAILEARDLMLFWAVYGIVRRLNLVGDGPSRDLWLKALPYALGAVAVIGAEGLLTLLVVRHYGPHPPPFLVPGAWRKEPITPVNRGRPYGWVNNPNVFGELGALAFALIMPQLSDRRRLPARLPYFGLAALFVLMVVFSYSRSAWIAFGLVVIVELIGSKDLRQAAAPLVGAVIAAILILTVPHAIHRVSQAGSQSSLTASRKSGRIHTLAEAEVLVRRRPLGTGLGTFGSGASRLFHQTLRGIPHTFYGDDNYAVLLVETGVPGLLLFIATGVAVYVLLYRSKRSPAARRMTAGLFLAVTALGAVGNSWEQLSLAVYPWLALAVLVGAGLPMTADERATPERQAA